MIQTHASITVGATSFGSFFAGPFPPGSFLSASYLWGTNNSGQFRIGVFGKRLSSPTAAVFAASGEFFSASDVPIGFTGAIPWLRVPLGWVFSNQLYVGIGITCGAGASFFGGIGFEYVLLGGGAGSVIVSSVPTLSAPSSVKSPSPSSPGVPSSPPSPHSPGYYGLHPGPG